MNVRLLITSIRTGRRLILHGLAVVLLKMLAIAVIVVWLVSRHQQLLPPALQAQPGPLTATLVGFALGISLVSLAIAGLQLRLLLRAQQFLLSYLQTVGLLLVGSFFGLVLPGPGREAVKAVYLCRNTPVRYADALAVLVADHALSAAGTAILGLIALPCLLAWRQITVPLMRSYATSMLQQGVHHLPWTAAVSVLLLLLIGGIAVFRRYSATIQQLIRRFVAALLRYRQVPVILWRCMGLAVLGHLISALYLLIGLHILNGHHPFTPVSLLGCVLVLGVCRRVGSVPLHLIGGLSAFLTLRLDTTAAPESLTGAEPDASMSPA